MADILTAEQQAAVENRGRSLLVSAAAGSGKTKVLVERLFSYVESGEANLDDFLIITYTRAAAAELRGKIAKVLGEKLQEDPLNAHLQRQLLRVYRADIKTVDAFCTALLRENCHLLREDARGHALRPDFRVLDENEAQLLRERVLARTLDEFYETMRDGDGASLLADTLGAGRDDRALGALVLELHGKLQAQPYMDRWLASQEQLWHDLPPRVEDTVYGTLLLSMVRRKALHCAALLRGAAEEMTSDAALADKYAPLFLGVAEQFALLAASAEEDWDAAAKRRVDFPRLTAVRKCGDEALKAKMQGVWNGCKKTAKGFDEVFSVTSAEAMEDLRAMAPAMLALLKLTADFSCAYQEEKRRPTSPTRSMRPLTCSSARTDSPPTLRERSRSATARSWWTNIRTRTRCRTASSPPFPVKEKTFSPSATSSRASTASALPTRAFSLTTICATRTLPTRRRARAQSSF